MGITKDIFSEEEEDLKGLTIIDADSEEELDVTVLASKGSPQEEQDLPWIVRIGMLDPYDNQLVLVSKDFGTMPSLHFDKCQDFTDDLATYMESQFGIYIDNVLDLNVRRMDKVRTITDNQEAMLCTWLIPIGILDYERLSKDYEFVKLKSLGNYQYSNSKLFELIGELY